jgi:hypothetical protein
MGVQERIMENDEPASILSGLAENAAPSAQIDLWPALKRDLDSNRWKSGPGAPIQVRPNTQAPFLRPTLVFVLILLLAFVILLTTPPGRAFAQKMLLFFRVTEEKSFLLPTGQVFPVPETPTPAPTYVLPLQAVEGETRPGPTKSIDPSCSTPASRSGYSCQIKAVEIKAGFDVKEFPFDPKGTTFSNASFDAAANQVTTEYVVTTGGGYLYLRQGINEFTPAGGEWSKVPSDAVEQVMVNGQYAEIATGTFVVYPNAASAVWTHGGQLILVWQEGNSWFVLEKLGDPYPIEWITRDELVRLAESLVDERPLDAVPPQDPEDLNGVAEAESLAGFDVLAPSFLPQGFELKRVAWVYDSVRLFYGPGSSREYALFIFMGPVENHQVGPCLECPPGTEEVVKVGSWQGWYWRGIFFTGPGVEGGPTPTPEWQADAKFWQLSWNTDELWISINYSPRNNGEEMNKETLIAIAESLE